MSSIAEIPDISHVQPEDMGPAISQNLVSVYVTIHRPAARPQAEKVDIQTVSDQDSSVNVKVDKKQITSPCWKIDVHPLWRQIDENARWIAALLFRFSASDQMRGDHLVSVSKVGEMLMQLRRLRESRLELAQEMKDKWESEIIPSIQKAFPDVFHQILPRLPNKDSLRDRFGVNWVIRPLTTVNPEDLDLRNLSDEEAQKVIEQTQQIAKDLAVQRFNSVFNSIFGEIQKVCEEVEKGAFDGNRRGDGALTDMLNILDRVNNFTAFAPAEMLQTIRRARDQISNMHINDLNHDPNTKRVIKSLMAPIATAIEELNRSLPSRGARILDL